MSRLWWHLEYLNQHTSNFEWRFWWQQQTGCCISLPTVQQNFSELICLFVDSSKQSPTSETAKVDALKRELAELNTLLKKDMMAVSGVCTYLLLLLFACGTKPRYSCWSLLIPTVHFYQPLSLPLASFWCCPSLPVHHSLAALSLLNIRCFTPKVCSMFSWLL